MSPYPNVIASNHTTKVYPSATQENLHFYVIYIAFFVLKYFIISKMFIETNCRLPKEYLPTNIIFVHYLKKLNIPKLMANQNVQKHSQTLTRLLYFCLLALPISLVRYIHMLESLQDYSYLSLIQTSTLRNCFPTTYSVSLHFLAKRYIIKLRTHAEEI